MNENVNLTDEKIIEKVCSENKDLYSIIIDRYENKLLRYALRLVQDKDKASHIVQDSFVKSYINLKGFNTKKKFSSWIYRIVHNESMNEIKKSKKDVPIPDNFEIQSEQDLTQDFEEKEIVKYVNRCLGIIPVAYSEPLSLFYLESKSYQEISEIMRIPMGTVATRINRAKKIMKKVCQKK
jgi:RNA polymerase sigma-70 factor (ECF subfamily)